MIHHPITRRKALSKAFKAMLAAGVAPMVIESRIVRAQVPLPFGFLGRAASSGAAASFMGLNTIAANSDTWAPDRAFGQIATAPVSGTLQSAFLYADGTNVSIVKMGVYTDDGDSIGNAPDTQVAISGIITSLGSAGWNSASFSGGTVTSGQPYWLVVFISAGSATVQTKDQASTSMSYKTAAGDFASPPANLGSYFTNSGNFGQTSMYVTIA